MNLRYGARLLLTGCAVSGVLAGCGAPSGMSPSAGSHTISAGIAPRAWMKPGASQGALLYATGYFNCGYNIPYTCVFAYPSGEQVGALAVGDTSLCSDSKGNVFIPDKYNESVLEYAHGGTEPIADLGDPGYRPVSCSVAPKSGDLAVFNVCAQASNFYCIGPGSIAIYRHAKGNPTQYQGGDIYWYSYGGYDGSGNVFVQGLGPSPSDSFTFEELPHGGSSLTPLTLDRVPNSPGQVQWDGSAMTIEDQYPPAIYRLKISGSKATVVGETHFRGKSIAIGPTWIQGNTVVVPYGRRGKSDKFVGLWRYPKGGKATLRIVNGFVSKLRGFDGVTVSVEP
jgi:hypothetical protein